MHFLLTHGHYSIFFISAYSLPSHPPPLFPLVFRVRERLDWVCFGDARPFLLSGGPQTHTAEPLVLYFTSSARRWLTRGQSSVADSIAISDNDERRQEGDLSRSV